MHPVLFKFGPVTIYTYGVMVFTGAMASYFYSLKVSPRFALSREFVSDLFFWSVIFGFLGARITYILLDIPGFIADPSVYIFTGSGFVFFGGMFSGALTVYWYSRKNKRNIADVCDMAAPCIALAHAFGRIGCFFYGCCYGHEHLFIPVQLLSSLCLFILFVFLELFSRKRPFSGSVACAYLILYGVLRFSIEFLRADPRGFYGPFSTSQWFSLFAVAAGVFIVFLHCKAKQK